MKVSIIQENEKKRHFGVKLKSRELNVMLRKTAVIVTGYRLQLG